MASMKEKNKELQKVIREQADRLKDLKRQINKQSRNLKSIAEINESRFVMIRSSVNIIRTKFSDEFMWLKLSDGHDSKIKQLDRCLDTIKMYCEID